MLITLQPDPNWQLSLAQLSPSLFESFFKIQELVEQAGAEVGQAQLPIGIGLYCD